MINSSTRQFVAQTLSLIRINPRLSGMCDSTLHWMACFGVLIAVVGCGSHEDHHEDEHLEHFVPAHKPASYAALVEQLETRVAQQSQPSESSETARSSTERQDLIDIIGWIPELAADSELRKQEFETAVSAGARLRIALGFEKPTEGTVPNDESSIPKLLEEMKALVSKSQTSTESI